ncbi:MAG: SOS response-associated peptidase [Bacteroidales bacterium]|nr:SOS response-associated peptidase [Bacteroidales bacterium]MCF8344984.1 SOS response-associated peptidase [Bacteroidales bacterium]MCF8350459.1 SOS response-associated peptidase [Bacteroidales bacterium]MCF8376208.1 SOS response-associated peptidase [Bacteroidales bacterium]MCF8401126.1 SOS response-associated peptidase [Bacteroidales bacterium]
MCGRYQLAATEEDIRIRFNVDVYEELYRPSLNCAPTQQLPVILNTEPQKLSFLKWGLIPFWAKDHKIGSRLINARSETIDGKPAFKHAFRKRRCLVVSSGFYEWKKEDKKKIPYRFFVRSEKLFSMAGIWEEWKDRHGKTIQSFSILTTSPNPLVGKIHNRMPVLLHPEQEQIWLKEENPAVLKNLLGSYPAEEMEAEPASL